MRRGEIWTVSGGKNYAGKPPAVVYWLRIKETQPNQQEQRVA